MKKALRVLLMIALLIPSIGAEAQRSFETFGRNRIQYRTFEWQYLSSDNFDVYYYDNRRKVATDALQYLESEFERITDLIGYPPYLKTKVFLYNSTTDLQQSNMGMMGQTYSVGVEAQFIKPYVEIAHPGTLEEFKTELVYKVSDLMVNEMMFGGSLKDMFQNAVLLNLPDWFVDGASRYVAYGWDANMDDYVRQLVKSRRVNRATKLEGNDAALVGQSIWNFVVERYGKGSMANILNYTRVIRNEQKSIYITLGVSFRQFMSDWKQFYSREQDRVAQSYVVPSDSQRLRASSRKSLIYTTVKISPDGQYLAYAENDRGRYTVKVRTISNGHEKTIISGGNKVFKQPIETHIPLISWSDDHTLGVVAVRNGEYVFWLYDLNTSSKVPRTLDKFNNVRSIDFSGNGRLAIMSADIEGQNDLFLLSTRRDRTRRLTNDLFDDFDPSFIPNSNTIVFSSNRTTDSISSIRKNFSTIPEAYNLYLYDLDSTGDKVTRITNTLSKDYYPKALDANTFYYLSEQRGIVNLFRFTRDEGVYTQVTNFQSSVKDYDIDFNHKKLALIMNHDLKEGIFLDNQFNFNRQLFAPPTQRRETQQAKVITERRKKEPARQGGVSIKQLINERLRQRQDSASQKKNDAAGKSDSTRVKTDSTIVKPVEQLPLTLDSAKKSAEEINTDNYSFDLEPAPVPVDTVTIKADPKQESLNTDNYKFEDEVAKSQRPSETFLSRYMRARETNRVSGPFPYLPKFSYENLVTNFVVDPLRGFSMRIETQMNDILENFRLFGGIQTAFDWKSGDVWGEAQYLKYRVDFSVRYDRKVIFWTQNDQLQKYTWQKIEFGASLPISVRVRASFKPFVGYTRSVDRGPDQNISGTPPVFIPAREQFYTGAKAELVYDNSVNTGLNIMEGTRGKINFIHYEAIGNRSASFSQISLDVRHYQKIYKEIVFAVRGYTGTFFGNSPKQYVLGGVDNWVGNRINYEGVRNPLYVKSGYNDQLIFTEFATSLRGFDYATLYGTSVAMANAELRVPIVRALAGGPVTSNFFRNLQLLAFYDIGSSWTGAPPINSSNTLRTEEVKEGPFTVNLKQYLNPWLYSYGVGFRTMMLGYYLKFDMAWPVENFTVKDPRLTVSMGFDF